MAEVLNPFMKFGYLFNIMSIIFLSSCSSYNQKKTFFNDKIKKASLKINQNLAEIVNHAHSSNVYENIFLQRELYFKASSLTYAGEYQLASMVFAQLIKLNPDSEYLKEKYIISLIQSGKLKESIPFLKDIFHSKSDSSIDFGIVLASVYLNLKKDDKAMMVYQKILRENKGNQEACVFLSRFYTTQKKVSQAIKTLNTCFQHTKKEKERILYEIGKVYFSQQKYSKALQYFRQAISYNKNFSLAIVGIGFTWEVQKKYSQAEKVYLKYIKENPNSIKVLHRIVSLYIAMGGDIDKVIPYAEKLNDLDAENLSFKLKLALIYFGKKKYNKALKTFNEILLESREEADRIYYYMGAIYQEIGSLDKAILAYEKVNNNSPFYEDSSLQRVHIINHKSLMEFSQEEKINGFWQRTFHKEMKALYKNLPDLQVDFSMLEAIYYERVGNIKKAVSSLEKVINSKHFAGNHKYYLASLYEKNKKYAESHKIIEEILTNDPKNADAWNFLGYALLERGDDLEQAHSFIQKALLYNQGNGYIRDSLGWYYFKKGEYQKALKEIKYASTKEPDDYYILKHLSIVYSYLHKFKLAEKAALKALKNAFNKKEKIKIKKMIENFNKMRLPASVKD